VALLWVDIGLSPQWYPTWWYLGPVTIAWTVIPPLGFALVIIGGVVGRQRHVDRLSTAEWVKGFLAGLTVLAAVFALYDLNVAEPGLFVSGLFPVVLAFLLALFVLAMWAREWLRTRSQNQ
jgi:TRAP-type C4-dicarboxylate transport system permease large subunit